MKEAESLLRKYATKACWLRHTGRAVSSIIGKVRFKSRFYFYLNISLLTEYHSPDLCSLNLWTVPLLNAPESKSTLARLDEEDDVIRLSRNAAIAELFEGLGRSALGSSGLTLDRLSVKNLKASLVNSPSNISCAKAWLKFEDFVKLSWKEEMLRGWGQARTLLLLLLLLVWAMWASQSDRKLEQLVLFVTVCDSNLSCIWVTHLTVFLVNNFFCLSFNLISNYQARHEVVKSFCMLYNPIVIQIWKVAMCCWNVSTLKFTSDPVH